MELRKKIAFCSGYDVKLKKRYLTDREQALSEHITLYGIWSGFPIYNSTCPIHRECTTIHDPWERTGQFPYMIESLHANSSRTKAY
jgi:hypothetical protein